MRLYIYFDSFIILLSYLLNCLKLSVYVFKPTDATTSTNLIPSKWDFYCMSVVPKIYVIVSFMNDVRFLRFILNFFFGQKNASYFFFILFCETYCYAKRFFCEFCIAVMALWLLSLYCDGCHLRFWCWCLFFSKLSRH